MSSKRAVTPACKLYKAVFEAVLPKPANREHPPMRYWVDDRGKGPKSCGFDFMDWDFHDRCSGRSQTASSLTIGDYNGKEIISGDVLIPGCKGREDSLMLTPSMELCDGAKINQIHFHSSSGGCDTTHVHVEMLITGSVSTKIHCATKMANFMGGLTQYLNKDRDERRMAEQGLTWQQHQKLTKEEG